jgi:spermidine synthase
MVVSNGNEISAGLMLAIWLLWTALGSGVAGLAWTRVARPQRLMMGLEIGLALALPATIYAIRASRGLMGALPGEVLGPGAILLTALLCLGPVCVLSGGLFAAGTRLYAQEAGIPAGVASSQVYLAEAVGAVLGGLGVSLLLPRLRGFAIALFVAALNLAAAVLLGATTEPHPDKTLETGFPRSATWHWSVAFLLLAGSAAIVPQLGARLEHASWRLLWGSMPVLESRDSRYGKLTVVQNEGSRTLLENGIPLFTVPDPAAAQEAVHYALLQHPAPARLLVIGGGMGGSVREALKHPSLQHVDYVEFDPEVFRLARRYFRNEWGSLSDSRISLIEGDGRRFLQNARQQWDVIVVSLPEPQTAQLNRYYTLEFFRQAQSRLTAGGLLAFALRSSENYISPERAAFLRCIQATLSQVFPQTGFIPGETIHFFAGAAGAIPSSETMLARLRQRSVQADYVGEYFLPFRMAPDRMAEMREVLQPGSSRGTELPHDVPAKTVPINRDFAPVAYYFDIVLWSTQFSRWYRVVLESLAGIRFGVLLAGTAGVSALLAALVAFLSCSRGRAGNAGFPGGGQAITAYGVASMGCNLMGLEVLLLLGFQALYGYLYYQLALLLALTMAGMAVGSWWALRAGLGRRALPGLQLAAVASAPACYGALLVLQRFWTGSYRLSDFAGQAAFGVLALLSGLLAGMQFPAANRALSPSQSPGSGSRLYALDLAGACAGALVISGYLVPVFGFAKAALVLAVVAAGPVIPLMLTGKQRDQWLSRA